MVENGGKAVSKVLVDAGYSEAYAKNPQKFKKTVKMQELLDHFLPRDLVMETHKNLLKAHKVEHMVFPTSVPQSEIEDLIIASGCKPKKFMFSDQATHVWYFAPDSLAQDRAVDKAYKLRGDYEPEKIQIDDPLRQLTDEELMAEIKRQTAKFQKK